MVSTKLQEAINAQINAELWSAYLYLAMGMDFEAKGYSGIANWFKCQFKEEQDHAFIFMNYLNSRDCKVVLKPIDAVPTEWDSALAAFEQTLEHEQKVTAMINAIYDIAEDERDYATRNRLNWFVDEQIEEEETARGIVDVLKRSQCNSMALCMLDKEMAARTYKPASAL